MIKSPTAKQVIAARKFSGMTQKAFGEFLECSLRAVQDWEYGNRNMSPPVWALWLLKKKELV